MKAIDNLDATDRYTLLGHFRGAIRARQIEWDHERCIEKILKREIEIDVGGVASCCDDPQTLSLNDAIGAINVSNEPVE